MATFRDYARCAFGVVGAVVIAKDLYKAYEKLQDVKLEVAADLWAEDVNSRIVIMKSKIDKGSYTPEAIVAVLNATKNTVWHEADVKHAGNNHARAEARKICATLDKMISKY